MTSNDESRYERIVERAAAAKAEQLKWWVTRSLGGLTFLVALGMAGCPHYNVWNQELTGRAALARAQQERQIRVAEAQAKLDSAQMLAQAEVARARGVSEANKIIGASLKNNEAYLRYLWIENLEQQHNRLIYIPTEAGLPILEASRKP